MTWTGRYLEIPRTAWLDHPAPKPASQDEDPGEVPEPELRLGRTAVTRIAGVTTALLYGVPTGVLIGTTAGVAVGAVAGLFGWLAGHSLADEYYTRHWGEEGW